MICKNTILIYFKKEDLNILKIISQTKNTTVSKTIMNIWEIPIKSTRDNLPNDFNIIKNAKEYNKRNKNKVNRGK